ncbi:hypothetical protein AALP_AA5G132600 [Arabis alpina]|uniref:Uncharacterized protein n=1 Tax=Arabis alpina TaxID=50452 RepID=A0A087GWT8_ARAAL|nr:hypothetical protein AALP_AA5G132600 [Arabis alpina]
MGLLIGGEALCGRPRIVIDTISWVAEISTGVRRQGIGDVDLQ